MRRGQKVKVYNEVVTFDKYECWCVGSRMIDHVICRNEAGERIVYTKVEFDKNKKE
jgi:hypothetical protein